MIERPTLTQLRERVHKDRHREIGNWLARRWARPTAIYGVWLAVRLGLSANQITLGALLAGLGGAAAIGSGTRAGFIVGVFLLNLSFWLDRVDGQVARWRLSAGLDGVYLDYLMHHATTLALGFALGFGLSVRTGDVRWALLGFAIASGWTVLSLHNDCRYKAFFQRLKRVTTTYRVVGGGGGRPSPPAPWPRRGVGVLTWPAFKACEPHVVLIGLSALALAAIVAPTVWVIGWRWGVALSAVLAPMLAVARVARAVTNQNVEAEFARWFAEVETPRPVHEITTARPLGGPSDRDEDYPKASENCVECPVAARLWV